jgi:hypothetical protein
MEVEMVFARRRSVFDRGSTEKRPKPVVRPVKPPSAPQPSKNVPLLDKRPLTGQKNDLELPGLDYS